MTGMNWSSADLVEKLMWDGVEEWVLPHAAVKLKGINGESEDFDLTNSSTFILIQLHSTLTPTVNINGILSLLLPKPTGYWDWWTGTYWMTAALVPLLRKSEIKSVVVISSIAATANQRYVLLGSQDWSSRATSSLTYGVSKVGYTWKTPIETQSWFQAGGRSICIIWKYRALI